MEQHIEHEEHEASKGIILIIDDSPTNLKFLFSVLGKAGFQVLLARNGETGIEQAIEMKPDIILLDILMYGIDGFETCRRLKANNATRDIPVIFMTVLSEPVDKLKGFQVGGVDYITKPLHYEEVLARINAHLTIRQQQEQLQEQTHRLQELNASKDTFFSIISRDLQTPFEELLHFTEFMAENIRDCPPEEVEEIVHTLQESVGNLYELLKNLFTWSSLQRGQMECYPQHIEVQEIIDRNIKLFRPEAEEKHIVLKSILGQEIPAYADAGMIYAVIRNLLSNALHFTETGGKVTVSAEKHERCVSITISDTGVGIAPDDLKKLFRVDVKHQQTGTAGEEGAGLGLLLCHELVKKNGGKLIVESTVGSGTAVTVRLPRIPLDDASQDACKE
jgi:signal transduction histidine kinase